MAQPMCDRLIPTQRDEREIDRLAPWTDDALPDVEAVMRRLAVAIPLERAGHGVYERLTTGGKRLRARLALASLEAFGGAREEGIGWAATCELVHDATLLDSRGGDRVRRGHRAEDLLSMLPFLALDAVDAEGEVRWRLARAVARRAEATMRGRSLALDLLGGRRTDWDTWRRATEGRNGALLALPVEGAAMIARLSPAAAWHFGQEFVRFGVLHQLADDMLDLYGDQDRGERGGDLREGKVSALVVEHLRLYPEDAPWLLGVLDAPPEDTADADVRAAIERFRWGGALTGVLVRYASLEARVLDAPLLRAVPGLHAVARELCGRIRSTLPVSRACSTGPSPTSARRT